MENFLTFLNKVCEPYPHVMPNELQRKIHTQRNKSMLVMMCSLILLISLCFPFYMRGPTKADKIFMVGALGNIIALITTCRSYPSLYRFLYALSITFNGPLASFYSEETIYGCWTGVNIYPLLLLYFIESKALYIFQMFFQIFCLHTIYKPRMVEALFNTTSIDFVSKIADGTTFSSVFSLIAMYLIGLHMQNSHKYELLIAEHKRGELERQKTFLLSFSHELRNLIHAIVGNIQLSLLEKLPPLVRYHIENAESGASVLLQFINNILDTGKVDVEDLEINPTPVILHDTLEKMWNICSYLLRAKELKGQLQISKNIPKVVKIDQYRLMQILLNLILNAVKYTQKGSVHVKLEWIEGEHEVSEKVFMPHPFDDENEGLFEKNQAMSILSEDLMSLSVDAKKWSSQEYNAPQGKDKGMLKITVTDTGCGIHPGNISKIFERNFNGTPTIGNRKLGTTLGLFITKTLCNRMGGNIRAFSKINKGASFICCLPAEPVLTENAVDVDAKCLVDFVKEWKMRVMIVDDLNFNVTVLKNYFQKIELGVAEVAKTGLEAYRKYVESVNNGKKLDIITMDVEMPVMSGKEAAQKIREYEIENGLEPCLLIMVSGNCSESEISECLEVKGKIRADYFLKKPVTYDDFFSTLAKYYGKRYED